MSEDNKKALTTAEFLAAFYKELVAGGIPEEVAERVLLSASAAIFENESIVVKGGE